MTARILIDIDGVLASFSDAALQLARDHFGVAKTHDDVLTWEITESIGLAPERVAEFYGHMIAEGYCASIPAYPGARELCDELRKLGDLVALTAPFPRQAHPWWKFEREQWLIKYMGFDSDDIIFASSKQKPHVDGDILIEDRGETCLAWARQRGGNRRAILLSRPYNQLFELKATTKREALSIRASDYRWVIEQVKDHLGAL